MDKNLRQLGWRVGLIVAFLVAYEAFIFLRWTFFSGREPSPLHDVETGLGILICLWVITKIGGWFEQREARDKEILAKIRNIDTRIEALYKWGEVDSMEHKEDDNNDWEWELDDATKATIARYRDGIREGDEDALDNLARIFGNQGITHYNAHNTESTQMRSRRPEAPNALRAQININHCSDLIIASSPHSDEHAHVACRVLRSHDGRESQKTQMVGGVCTPSQFVRLERVPLRELWRAG